MLLKVCKKGAVNMALQESGEMYLETILILSREKGSVRSIDISEHMGYSKPSVSRAVGLLKSGNYITVEDDGHILLTDEGRQIAEKIMSRHTLLTRMLESLGVSRETAAADACKMEHVISDETFDAIKNHMQQYGTNK
jgi:Mn-dependent DtxR family transcriptional regulator